MKKSSQYFENRECEYYPCHKGVQDINCLFCYCPLYHMADCPGNYGFIETNGKKLKECTNCTFPHEAENYEVIIAFLSNKSCIS